jgi:asparagine synthase (glutamine-hydrolysing)
VGALLANIALDWRSPVPFHATQLARLHTKAFAKAHTQQTPALSVLWAAAQLAQDSDLAAQPRKDRDLWLIFDGILFNHAELCKVVNIPETAHIHALLVAMWRRFGEKLLAQLDGEFALVLIDTQLKTALLARDRLGTRALYWRINDQMLSVSNQVNWLRSIDWKVNETELARYFSVHPPSLTETFFAGIQKVPAGSALLLKADRTHTLEFAKPNVQPLRRADPSEVSSQIQSLLLQSINKRVPIHAPIATSLSGGIDSNTVFALAKMAGVAHMSAITWGFDNLPVCEESHFAKAHADDLSVPFHRIKADQLGMFTDRRARSTSLNSPFNHPYRELLNAVRARARQNGAQTLLHGAYGDTQFFPKTDMLVDQFQRRDWLKLASTLTRALRHQINPLQNTSVRRLLRHISGKPLQVIGNYFSLSDYARDLIGEPPPLGSFRDWQLNACLGASAQLNAEFEAEYSEISGVRSIYPLRDWDLMHLMLSLPVDFGHRDGTNKWIWRHMMRDQLPHCISTRPKSTSLTPFFQAQIARVRPALLLLLAPGESDFHRFVDAQSVRSQLTSGYTEFEGAVIWRCISYELWRTALGLRAPVPGLF